MKRFVWTLGIVLTGAVIAVAQPPGGPGVPSGRGPGPGGPGGDFQPPPTPIVEALDTDNDRVISADELQNAPRSLVKLDANKDGKLTEDEFRPRFPIGGQGGQPGARGNGTGGQGGRGDNSRAGGQRNPAGRGPGGGQGNAGPNGPGRGPNAAGPNGPNPDRMVDQAMEFDADKDGMLSREELARFAQEFAQRQPGGPGGGPGGANGPGGRQDNAPFERPRRPE